MGLASMSRRTMGLCVGLVACGTFTATILTGCGDNAGKARPSTTGSSPAQQPPADRAVAAVDRPAYTDDFSTAVVRSALREQAIETLLAGGRSRDPSIRANAAEAAQLAPQRLESLIAAALKDDNLGVRAVGAVSVGKAKLRSLAPALRPLMSDSSPFVRSSALFGLQCCGETVDLTPLSTFLLDDPSPKVRSHAAYLLGELGDKSAIPMIKTAAKKPMPRASEADVRLMQLQFAEALVKLGDEGQIHSIRAALYPSRVEELEATALAVQVIGTLKDRGASDQLIYLSAKEDDAGNPMPAEIRLGIASSLAQIGNKRGNFIAEQYWKDPNPVLRAQAASVFGFTGQTDSLPYLKWYLTSDQSEQVRVSAAAGVLRAVGGTR
ncbi:MAG: hypothetical protein AMXMBFR58_31820 [Phycisphaerae bacterium]|nr:hypothetical protein [Phycisphaerales bacterium]